MANKYFKVIKALTPAKNLTSRRKTLDEMVKTISDQYKKVGVKEGSEASKAKKKFWRKSSDIHDKYEKDVKASKEADKKFKRKVIGGAGAAGAVVIGAHGAAKKKWPKYKKFMESSLTIKDGKLGLKSKKD
tara:strand:+ start:35 stop:427 length:393 start_codon:yes stop_codon:yes gene_type:complete